MPHPWPRVFFTDHIEHEKNAKKAAKALRTGDARAVVFGADAQAVAAHDGSEAVELRADFRSVNKIDLSVDAPSDGLVVFNEAWDPGWRATVDGADVPIHRVNLLHRAVEVSAGSHEVELRYRPPGLRLLSLLWLITLPACLLAIPIRRRPTQGGRDSSLVEGAS